MKGIKPYRVGSPLIVALAVVAFATVLGVLAGPALPEAEPQDDRATQEAVETPQALTSALDEQQPLAAATTNEPAACVEDPGDPDAEGFEPAAAGPKKPRGCKPCSKDRRWCECTYNGLPRVSCDPCCYSDGINPYQVCLD